MTLYGFRSFTHGWQFVLTVVCPDGVSAANALIKIPNGIEPQERPGHLTRYFEQREGAIDAMVEKFGITMLERSEWDRIKQSLGDSIFK